MCMGVPVFELLCPLVLRGLLGHPAIPLKGRDHFTVTLDVAASEDDCHNIVQLF